MAIISHIFSHPNKQQLYETEPKHQQYTKRTRINSKEDLIYENSKSKTIKTTNQLKKRAKVGHTVLDAVHDHRALLTLKFCKAISSTYDENGT